MPNFTQTLGVIMGLTYAALTGLLLVAILLHKMFGKPEKNPGDGPPKPNFNVSSATIFYHEDDYCQIQILPSENLQFLKGQAEVILGQNDSTMDQPGFKNLIVRDEEKFPLNKLQITKSELESVIGQLNTTKHEIVSTGYGQNYRVLSGNTNAYGKDYSAVFYGFTSEGIIDQIWLTNIWNLKDAGISQVLNQLGKKWNLVLMDWNSLELVYLSEHTAVDQYLNKNAT